MKASRWQWVASSIVWLEMMMVVPAAAIFRKCSQNEALSSGSKAHGRLIQDQEIRLVYEGDGEADALAHTAAQAGEGVLLALGQGDPFDSLVNGFAPLG